MGIVLVHLLICLFLLTMAGAGRGERAVGANVEVVDRAMGTKVEEEDRALVDGMK